jgi:hypothetical protein
LDLACIAAAKLDAMQTITPELENILNIIAPLTADGVSDPCVLADERLPLIGVGDQAAIYGYPGRDDLVVRVSHSADGWFAYATGASLDGELGRHPDGQSSPHVPRHHGLCCLAVGDDPLQDHRWVAITERLQPCKKNHPLVLSAQRVLGPWEYGEATSADRSLLERAVPGLLELADAWEGRLYDFHAANWMMRGDTLVLNDPIAVMSSPSQVRAMSRLLIHSGGREAEPERERTCVF